MGYIYMIENSINQKKYIGKTTKTIDARWKEHIYAAQKNNLQYPLYKAMRKYGVENFIVKEIEKIENEQLNSREQYWIEYYNTYCKNNMGYNATCGGEGNIQYDRKRVYELWDSGLCITEIANEISADRSTIREILQDYQYYSIEESLSRGNLFSWKNKGKNICQYDIYGNFIKEYSNPSEAERETGISHKNIHIAVNQKGSLTAGGYQWKFKNDDRIISDISSRVKKYKQPVQQYTLDNILVAEYESAAVAAKIIGCNSGTIRNACKGKTKKAKGYIWKYKKGECCP